MLILHLARHVVVDNEREKVVPDPFSLSLSGNAGKKPRSYPAYPGETSERLGVVEPTNLERHRPRVVLLRCLGYRGRKRRIHLPQHISHTGGSAVYTTAGQER